jgi:protoporphyrinogen oxidase
LTDPRTIESTTIVVGGGPAGLAAAYRLSDGPFRQVLLLERAPRLGGLAAGIERDGMRLDFGPHRLHAAADPEVMRDLQRLLGDEIERRERRGRIYLDGTYLPFPPGPRALARLGVPTAIGILAAMLAARFRPAPPPANYEEAVRRVVGDRLYDRFYGPFAAKVWGRPGNEIAVEQAQRRVNQRGLGDFLRLLVGRSPSRYFLYPRGGFGRIPQAYAEVLAERPNVEISTSAEVTAVDLRDDRVDRVEYQVGGGARSTRPAHLVWTAPITDLARLAHPVPASIQQRARELRTRAVVICFAVIARPGIGTADTYYFPQAQFPFNRVMEQKRFSRDLVPANRTVLVMDVPCDPDSAEFSAGEADLRARVATGLADAGLCRTDEIVDFWAVRFRSAYPVYSLSTAAALDVVRDWTDQIQNLWLAGRQGLFLHNNTHHSLLMGYRAAAAIGSQDRAAWLREVESFADFTVAD